MPSWLCSCTATAPASVLKSLSVSARQSQYYANLHNWFTTHSSLLHWTSFCLLLGFLLPPASLFTPCPEQICTRFYSSRVFLFFKAVRMQIIAFSCIFDTFLHFVVHSRPEKMRHAVFFLTAMDCTGVNTPRNTTRIHWDAFLVQDQNALVRTWCEQSLKVFSWYENHNSIPVWRVQTFQLHLCS